MPQKQKDVLQGRFGLKNGETETLQKIGDGFGVTRERVRQIEREGLSNLQPQKKQDYLQEAFTQFVKHLEKNGGLKREDLLFRELGGDEFQNHVRFLLTLGDPFNRFSENEDVFAFWALEKDIYQKVAAVVGDSLKKFTEAKKPLPEDILFAGVPIDSPAFFLSSLEITKKIEKGPLGEFGLVSWPEVKPRGVRDAAFLALKKTGRPLHFREIAGVAGGLSGFSEQRPVLPQTVHNELIRDERFILVGRGVYGLKDWGYMPGTVKDVIVYVLKNNKKPMAREEILEEVQKQRLVKANTVFLNLGDKNYFSRNNNGHYTLKA